MTLKLKFTRVLTHPELRISPQLIISHHVLIKLLFFQLACASGCIERSGRRGHAGQVGSPVPAAGRQGRGDQPALAAGGETQGANDGAGGTHRLHEVCPSSTAHCRALGGS